MNNKEYKTGNGSNVSIEKLSNAQLLKMYRFFVDYTRTIKKTIKESPHTKEDKEYMATATDLMAIKEAFRAEIRARSLRIGTSK